MNHGINDVGKPHIFRKLKSSCWNFAEAGVRQRLITAVVASQPDTDSHGEKLWRNKINNMEIHKST